MNSSFTSALQPIFKRHSYKTNIKRVQSPVAPQGPFA